MEGCLNSLSRKKFIDTASIYSTKLSRCLTRLDLTLLGVASTLGAGIYVLSDDLARRVAGPAVVLSFSVAGLITFLAILCYSELVARIPKVGSAYTFTYASIGELYAFVIGWNLVLEYLIATSSLGRAWSGYLDSTMLNNIIKNYTFTKLGGLHSSGFTVASYPDILAFVVVLIVTILLSFGVKFSSLANNVVTAVNLLVILFIVVVGSTFVEGKNWTDNFIPYGFSGVLAASASAFYAFNGFDVVATAVEEANDPVEDMPIAMVLTVGICFLAYFGVSAVLTLMCPYDQLATRGALPEVFAMRGATWAKYIIAVGALCGLSASLIGALFPLPRMLYAMASDGLIFKFLAKVHPRTEIPVIATAVSGVLAAVLALIFDLQALVEMMSIGTLMAYAIVALCVLLLRYQPGSVGLVKEEKSVFSTSYEELEPTSKENSDLETENNGPTPKSARAAAVAIFCSLTVFFFLSVLLTWGLDALSGRQAWAIFLACLLSILLVASIALLARQPQNKTPLPFKVPCVPAIPLCSIFTNIFLILKLSYLTWIRFAVWMTAGLTIYIFYGIRHSVEGKRQDDQSGYFLLQQVDRENDTNKQTEAQTDSAVKTE